MNILAKISSTYTPSTTTIISLAVAMFYYGDSTMTV
jgi:hypothetical protein